MRKFLSMILLGVCPLMAHAQYDNVNLGDIIEINGVKGIVFQLDETGCHGTVMSIKCLRGVSDSWCNDGKLSKAMPETSDENDGLANTTKVIEFAKFINYRYKMKTNSNKLQIKTLIHKCF